MKNLANKLNRVFSKEEVQMPKQHMKKCFTSLAPREMQIKTTLRLEFNPVSLLERLLARTKTIYT
jgi:hypothetical protein